MAVRLPQAPSLERESIDSAVNPCYARAQDIVSMAMGRSQPFKEVRLMSSIPSNSSSPRSPTQQAISPGGTRFVATGYTIFNSSATAAGDGPVLISSLPAMSLGYRNRPDDLPIPQVWHVVRAERPDHGGVHVHDPAVFDTIRQRYRGTWNRDMDFCGEVGAEVLKDGTLLLELTDDLAAFAFDRIAGAQEDICYKPATGPSVWDNYFDRVGSSIRAGLASGDLKEDPFSSFHARLRIDAQGRVISFAGRCAATSLADPSLGGWQEERDFHCGRVGPPIAAHGTPEDPYGTVDGRADLDQAAAPSRPGPKTFRSGANAYPSHTGFHLQFGDDVAQAVYDQLDMAAITARMGPANEHHIKYGEQLWCTRFEAGGYKCRIVFNASGAALPPSRRGSAPIGTTF